MTDKKLYSLYGEYLKLFSEKIESGEFDSSYNPMNFREWETQIREDPDSMVEFYNGDVPKFVDYEDKFEEFQTVDSSYEEAYEEDLNTFKLAAKPFYNEQARCAIAHSIKNLLKKDMAKAHILLSNVKDITSEGNVLSIKVMGLTYIIEVR
jgi:hypothetical protein